MARILRSCCLYLFVPLLISVGILLISQRPEYSGEFISKKGYNPITIRRDKMGIPTIESKTLVDTYYGLGYVHAQDRLWVVNFRRALYSGRLSEILGSETLILDKFFRNLSLRRYCEVAEENVDEETKALFYAYIDGFNDSLGNLKVLPLEFWITWSKVEPLTLVDAAMFGKTISFFLAMDFQYEFIFDTLERLVGHEKAMDILPIRIKDYRWQDKVILNDDDLKQEGLYDQYVEGKPNAWNDPLGLIPEERRPFAPLKDQDGYKGPEIPIQESKGPDDKKGLGDKIKQEFVDEKTKYQTGSNAWVVHGNHTDTGKPILANDPHLPNGMPSFWYPASLIYEDNYATGMSYPGFTGISFGRTKYVSWGFTNLCADTTDLYKLKVQGEAYYYEGAWRPLKKYEEKIYVRGKSEPEIIYIYESHHGVLIDEFAKDIFLGMNFRPEQGIRYALSWVGYIIKNPSLKPFNRIMHAKTAQQFIDNWKISTEPSMALVFATTEGDIGFVATGRIPIKKNVRDGPKPKDGTTKEDDWLGYVPWEHQPKVINPKKGYIVSANNKFATDNLKWGISANMWITPRAARITDMITDHIKKGEKISVNYTKKMQMDTLDMIAQDFTGTITKFIEEGLKRNYPLSVPKDTLVDLVQRLKKWDFTTGTESVEASIYGIWHHKFIHLIMHKIGLTEEQRLAVIGNFKFEAFAYRKMHDWESQSQPKFDDYWCSNDKNQNVEAPCLYNLVKALEQAYIHLSEKLGSNVDGWEWGKIHSSQYHHFPFSETPLKGIFHRSIPSGGTGRAIFANGFLPEKGVDGVYGPNMRMIVSLKEGEKSYSIVDTGVSDNIMSEHYADQMKPYHNGEYYTMVQSLKDLEVKDTLKVTFSGK